jgi:hypothetical protein
MSKFRLVIVMPPCPCPCAEHVRDRTWQGRILPRPPVLGDVHPGSPEKAQHVIMRNAGIRHSVTPAFEAAADQRGIGQGSVGLVAGPAGGHLGEGHPVAAEQAPANDNELLANDVAGALGG